MNFRGICPSCNKEVVFRSRDSWLRDNFYCTNCYSIPRERALMLVIEKYYPNWKELKIHESSPETKGTSLKLKTYCSAYTASQYYNDAEPGKSINGFINQNLENQTFDDNCFDLVITQDVMEHVVNPEKAFAEIARTLKPGGAHIFTVPLVNKFQPTERWAVLDENSNIKFLKTPEYHGNPIDPKGSPVTMHWGFDIVDHIKSASGMDTEIIYMDDLHYGIRAEFIEVLVSRKLQ
ncbi:MAG: class I SAM-dependent methyltransferase [Ignavibacteria bacterium]|nr:class I SAM-dependent methyltransferase [Ignavibacteria bacterium]